VSAINALGTSDPSGRSNSVVVPTAPSAPTNVAAAAQPDGTVTVSWTDPPYPGTAITGYTITPSPACPACTGTSVTNGSATSANIGGLTAGSAYTFTMTATDGVGTSPASAASNSVSVPTVPGAPLIGSATAGNGQATVNWTAPVSNGGSAIIGYVVTPYIGAAAQASQTFASTATTEVVTGLTNGTAYTFVVAAKNGVGIGPVSGASNATTPATVPGAPTIGAVAGAGSGKVTVNFTAPASNGGSPITSYTVTATDVTNSLRGGQTATGAGSPITITGLHTGDRYTFTVKATNAMGAGASSAASSQITSP
jgi:trimeric autotransporter adhesin